MVLGRRSWGQMCSYGVPGIELILDADSGSAAEYDWPLDR